jgi:hypothetical protein
MWARNEASNDGRGEPRVGERLAPFAEGRVRGDRDRGPRVALGENVEKALVGRLGEFVT